MRKKTGETAVAQLRKPEQVAELLRMLQQIADELAWRPGDQLHAYLATSRHFAVYVQDELAGGMQLVLPDDEGRLPYRAVWPEVILPPDVRPAHITILALRQDFRGRPKLFWPLCVEVWRFCATQKIDTLLLEATPSMLERYRRIGWPLEIIGDLRLHWGEECYLCHMPVRSVAGELLVRAMRSPQYRALVAQAARSLAEANCAGHQSLP